MCRVAQPPGHPDAWYSFNDEEVSAVAPSQVRTGTRRPLRLAPLTGSIATTADAAHPAFSWEHAIWKFVPPVAYLPAGCLAVRLHPVLCAHPAGGCRRRCCVSAGGLTGQARRRMGAPPPQQQCDLGHRWLVILPLLHIHPITYIHISVFRSLASMLANCACLTYIIFMYACCLILVNVLQCCHAPPPQPARTAPSRTAAPPPSHQGTADSVACVPLIPYNQSCRSVKPRKRRAGCPTPLCRSLRAPVVARVPSWCTSRAVSIRRAASHASGRPMRARSGNSSM